MVLLDHIGQGTFGTVYVASWRGCLVAAKVMPSQLSETAAVNSLGPNNYIKRMRASLNNLQ